MKSSRQFALSHLRIAIAGALLTAAAVTAYLSVFGGANTAYAEDPPPTPVTHQRFNGVEGPITQAGDGAPSVANYRNPPSPICSTTTSNAANVNTDCEGNAPHNETSIAVNPTNPRNPIGSANDYQLLLRPGGTVYQTLYSRANVTFDGGKTWTTYPVDYNNYTFTGDPAVAFDANGTAYLATLGFLVPQGNGCCTNPDVLVTHSNDGGRNWIRPVRVASGSETFSSPGIFNDKEYMRRGAMATRS